MSTTTLHKGLEEYYKVFKQEAEHFYITKFIETTKIQEEYKTCIDIIFDVTGTIEPKGKGILTFNPSYGQGKTFIFEVLNHIYRRKHGHYFFKFTNARELVNIYKEHGEAGLKDLLKVRNLFVDDIGDEGEVKIFKHFANELNVLRWVILKRYDMWLSNASTQKNYRFFGSTNLTKQMLAKEYGGRVADRLEQMAHYRSFEFLGNGKSFRQFEGTRRLTPDEVRKNWQLYKPKKEVEQIDLVGYMNELLKEDEAYLNLNDWPRLVMIKDFLTERKLVAFDDIPTKLLEEARLLHQTAGQTVDEKRRRFMQAKSIEELTTKVLPNKVYDALQIAELLHTKATMLKLSKRKNFCFE